MSIVFFFLLCVATGWIIKIHFLNTVNLPRMDSPQKTGRDNREAPPRPHIPHNKGGFKVGAIPVDETNTRPISAMDIACPVNLTRDRCYFL